MKYTGRFRNINETLYKVEINTPVSGPDKTIDLNGEAPFITQMDDSKDTIYVPVKYGGATVQVITDDLMTDCFSSEPKDVEVTLFNETENETEWHGYVTPSAYDNSFENPVDVIELECIDGLSTLQYLKYHKVFQEYGKRTFVEIIDAVLGQAGYSEYYVSNNTRAVLTLDQSGGTFNFGDYNFIPRRQNRIEEPEIGTEPHNVIERLVISDLLFKEKDTDDGNEDSWTCDEVLEEICKYLGVTAVDYRGKVYFIDYDALINGIYDFNHFTIGDLVCDGTINLRNEYYIDGASHTSNDNTVSIVDAYNKVSVEDDFKFIEDENYKIFDNKNLKDYRNYQENGIVYPDNIPGLGLGTYGDGTETPYISTYMATDGNVRDSYSIFWYRFMTPKPDSDLVTKWGWIDYWYGMDDNRVLYPIDKPENLSYEDINTKYQPHINGFASVYGPVFVDGQLFAFEERVQDNSKIPADANESEFYRISGGNWYLSKVCPKLSTKKYMIVPFYATENSPNSDKWLFGFSVDWEHRYRPVIGKRRAISIDFKMQAVFTQLLSVSNGRIENGGPAAAKTDNKYDGHYINTLITCGDYWYNGTHWKKKQTGETENDWLVKITVDSSGNQRYSVSWTKGFDTNGLLIIMPEDENALTQDTMYIARDTKNLPVQVRFKFPFTQSSRYLIGTKASNDNFVPYYWKIEDLQISLVTQNREKYLQAESKDKYEITNVINDNFVNEFSKYSMKICTHREDRETNLSEVGFIDSNGSIEYLMKTYNRATAEEASQEEHILSKLTQQYSTPAYKLNFNIHPVKPWTLATNLTINGRTFIVDSFNRNYMYDSDEVSLTEKKH